MRKTLIAVAAATVVASGAAWADTPMRPAYGPTHAVPAQYAPNDGRWDDRSVAVNEREARIRMHIERGMTDGRITQREARGLLRQLASVESKERAYRSDGRLNRRETADLHRDLDRVAANVRGELRDGERRYPS